MSETRAVPVEKLTVADLRRHPVWEFVSDDELGETAVRPVPKLPVETLDGRLVGTQVRLANGKAAWALLGDIDTLSARATEQFLTLTVYRRNARFHLARYFDVARARLGPAVLAKFLGLSVRDVFPISFDVSEYCSGPREVLAGMIDSVPRERLKRSEIMKLAVRGRP